MFRAEHVLLKLLAFIIHWNFLQSLVSRVGSRLFRQRRKFAYPKKYQNLTSQHRATIAPYPIAR
jgi:hypothetical protein